MRVLLPLIAWYAGAFSGAGEGEVLSMKTNAVVGAHGFGVARWRLTLVRAASLVAVLCLARDGAAQGTIRLLDESRVGGVPVVVVGTDGLPLIAYFANPGLKVAHCGDATCASVTFASLPETANEIDFAIGADGRGVASYADALNRIRVARCADATCTSLTSATIDSGVWLRGRTSIAIGADGLPLVTYLAYPAASGETTVLKAVHCSDVACAAATVSNLGTVPVDGLTRGTDLAIGADGLGLVAYAQRNANEPAIVVAHCSDAVCSRATRVTAPSAVGSGGALFAVSQPAIGIGLDGRGLVSYRARPRGGATPDVLQIAHCANLACSGFSSEVTSPTGLIGILSDGPGMTPVPASRPWIVHGRENEQILVTCADDACTTYSEQCVAAHADALTLARGADGQAITAFATESIVDFFRYLRFAHGFGGCPLPFAAAQDALAFEDPFFPQNIQVRTRLSRPMEVAGSVSVRTRDVTATAGEDYAPVPATVVPLAVGQREFSVTVTIFADRLFELDEQFELVLSEPVNIALQDDVATVTIRNSSGNPPTISVGDCWRAEGDAGAADCAFNVTLDGPSGVTATVSYSTTGGTATAGVDYQTASGVLTFAPGQVAQAILVSLVGDLTVENDETFQVLLADPTFATIGDGEADGTILDDDAPSLSSLELVHGSRVTADLAAGPGPVPDVDYYRLAQPPRSSWEIVVDAASGDVAADLAVDLLAADNATVLASATPTGTGTARSLRFQNRELFAVTSQHIRVRSGSCTACGADDGYRLRAYETTLTLPRFNNTAAQGTVLILQNTTEAPVAAVADFWKEDGTHLVALPFVLDPHGSSVTATGASIPLFARSGSATITHDAPYGTLAGKAVALEPTTGYTFDTLLEYRPR